MTDRIKSLFGLGSWLAVLAAVALFSVSGLARAGEKPVCFTAAEVAGVILSYGGRLAYAQKDPTAVAKAVMWIGTLAQSADYLEIYVSYTSQVGVVLYEGGCALDATGSPAADAKQTAMYTVSKEFADRLAAELDKIAERNRYAR